MALDVHFSPTKGFFFSSFFLVSFLVFSFSISFLLLSLSLSSIQFELNAPFQLVR